MLPRTHSFRQKRKNQCRAHPDRDRVGSYWCVGSENPREGNRVVAPGMEAHHPSRRRIIISVEPIEYEQMRKVLDSQERIAVFLEDLDLERTVATADDTDRRDSVHLIDQRVR